ncbi:hypothetical protein PSSHI_20940 [Photobacterium sp. R1]
MNEQLAMHAQKLVTILNIWGVAQSWMIYEEKPDPFVEIADCIAARIPDCQPPDDF